MTSCDNCNVEAHCCAGESRKSNKSAPQKANTSELSGTILSKTCFGYLCERCDPSLAWDLCCCCHSVCNRRIQQTNATSLQVYSRPWPESQLQAVEMDRHTLFKLPLRVEGVVRRHSQQPDDAVQVSEISSSSALKNTTKASSLHISMESMIHLSESGHNQPWINRLIWSSGKSLKVL